MIDQIVVSRTTLLRQLASEISLCTNALHLAAYPKGFIIVHRRSPLCDTTT